MEESELYPSGATKNTRENCRRVFWYLKTNGPVCDHIAGRATSTLRDGVGYKASVANFGNMLRNLEELGLVYRKVGGKHTYEIGLVDENMEVPGPNPFAIKTVAAPEPEPEPMPEPEPLQWSSADKLMQIVDLAMSVFMEQPKTSMDDKLAAHLEDALERLNQQIGLNDRLQSRLRAAEETAAAERMRADKLAKLNVVLQSNIDKLTRGTQAPNNSGFRELTKLMQPPTYKDR